MPEMSSPSLIAITHSPPPALERGERTFVPRTPIDFPLARRQHAAYCELLAACGAAVTTLTVNSAHADAVFVEDTALVLDECAILMRPGAESRRAEPDGLEPELRRYRDLHRIGAPATLDGGDIIVAGRRILVGASSRSNAAGADALRAIVGPHGYGVERVPMRDCLHLKSAGCTLPDGRLFVNPAWVRPDDLPGFSLVAVPPEEPFAADVVTMGNTVIVSSTNPRSAALLDGLGFDVRSTDLSEFEKAEGGVTCLSLIFRAP